MNTADALREILTRKWWKGWQTVKDVKYTQWEFSGVSGIKAQYFIPTKWRGTDMITLFYPIT